MITIRFFTPDDFPEVCALSSFFEFSPYQIDLEFKKISSVQVPFLITYHLSNPDIITLVAEKDHRVIGFISFIFEKNINQFLKLNFQSDTKFASILFLVVDKEHRSKGVGTLLLKSCIQFFEKQGIRYIRIGTDYGNFQALSLYQKLGFQLSMSWHTYRIYKEGLTYQPSNIFSNWENSHYWAEDPEIFLYRRPIPWYYEPRSSKQQIHCYILERFQDQLRRKKIMVIGKQIEKKSLGIILQRDIWLEKGYQLKGCIYHITDLIESEQRGELLSSFLRDILLELPNFLMAETWIPAHDYASQKIVQKAGMQFCYGGISLFLDLLNYSSE